MYAKIGSLRVGDQFMEERYPEVWEVTKVATHTYDDGTVVPKVETVVVDEHGLRSGETSRVGETSDWWSHPSYEYASRIYRI